MKRFSISDLAEEFNISSRSLRFYEEKGLITPERSKGNQRVYDERDFERMKLILRGKRLGYSLNEIGEMIGYDNIDMDEITQIKKGIEYGERKLIEVRRKIDELKALEEDLVKVDTKLKGRLGDI
ncbi:MAG: MerR family transcriptional regulator [Desulfobacterales bacterium]|nr:MerR family transcriptional regulator [Desulfobacterales bacterium]MCP4158459.1 MerR family transcriptional regulator [Deltaproteobacteria bacterium]